MAALGFDAVAAEPLYRQALAIRGRSGRSTRTWPKGWPPTGRARKPGMTYRRLYKDLSRVVLRVWIWSFDRLPW